MLLDFDGDDMYRDWSGEFRTLESEAVPFARWHADGAAHPRL